MDRPKVLWHNLDDPDERRELPGITLEFLRVGGLFASRSTTQPGWRWSTHIGPIAGTASCQVAHRGIVVSGHMRVEMARSSSPTSPANWPPAQASRSRTAARSNCVA